MLVAAEVAEAQADFVTSALVSPSSVVGTYWDESASRRETSC